MSYRGNIKTAKFNLGDLVIHQAHGYRAVVVDIDPLFQPSGRYNPQAIKRPFTYQNPWYRLLVDESSQQTYVEEPLLRLDYIHKVIKNPYVVCYLIYHHERYLSIINRH